MWSFIPAVAVSVGFALTAAQLQRTKLELTALETVLASLRKEHDKLQLETTRLRAE